MDLLKYFRREPKPATSPFSAKSKPCPYTDSRRTWRSHNGAVFSMNTFLQIVTMVALLITLSAVGGYIHTTTQSKFVPYVVEVDKLGQSVAIFPAGKAKEIDTRIVRSSLAAWVSNLRMVTPDIAVQRKAIFEVYAHLSVGDPAIQKTHEWLNGSPENTPFARAEDVTVHTSNYSIIAQSPDTWQVDWTETVRDREGVMKKEPFRMRALITVYVVHPTSATSLEDMQKNPLGLFIKDYNWSEQIR